MYKLQKQAFHFLKNEIERSKHKLEILNSVKQQTKKDGTVYRDYNNFRNNFTSTIASIYNRTSASHQLLLIQDKALYREMITIRLNSGDNVHEKIRCVFEELERLKAAEERHLQTLINQLSNVELITNQLINNVLEYNQLISANKEIAEALHLYRNLNINDNCHED